MNLQLTLAIAVDTNRQIGNVEVIGVSGSSVKSRHVRLTPDDITRLMEFLSPFIAVEQPQLGEGKK